MRQFILKSPALALSIGFSIIVATGSLILAASTNTFAQDFSVYYRAAVEPSAMAYQPHGLMPFPYAPTMLLWIKPLALLPFWIAFAVWIAVSITSLWAATKAHLTDRQRWLVFIAPPVVACLITGQVSAVMTALLLWACATSNRWLAGVAFAVVASVKPQLVLLAPLWLAFDRDWQAFVSAGLAFVGLVFLSVLLFGAHLWVDWFNSLEEFNRILHAKQVLSVAATPAGVAEYLHLPGPPFQLLGACLGIWIAAKWRGTDALSRTASITAASLLAAPYALVYDLVPIVPFLVYLVFHTSFSAAVALSGALNPGPLLLTALCLKRRSSTEG